MECLSSAGRRQVTRAMTAPITAIAATTRMAVIPTIQVKARTDGYRGPAESSEQAARRWSEGRRCRKGVVRRCRSRRRPPTEGRLDARGQSPCFGRLALFHPVLELRHHLPGEELERLTDVLMAVTTGLTDEDQLVDSGLLVGPHQFPDLIRSAHRPPQGSESLLHQLGPKRLSGAGRDRPAETEPVAVFLEFLPDIGEPRLVLAEDVVVGQGVTEEVATVDAPVDGGGLVLMAHHGQHASQVG